MAEKIGGSVGVKGVKEKGERGYSHSQPKPRGSFWEDDCPFGPGPPADMIANFTLELGGPPESEGDPTFPTSERIHSNRRAKHGSSATFRPGGWMEPVITEAVKTKPPSRAGATPPILGKLLSGSFWLVVKTPVQAILALWTVPLILEAADTNGLGAYALAFSFGFFQLLFEFGMSSALQRQVSEPGQTAIEKERNARSPAG